ncbi:hypothetical protein ACFQU2_13215 [Siccirubricoccus deserti]
MAVASRGIVPKRGGTVRPRTGEGIRDIGEARGPAATFIGLILGRWR